MIVLIGIPMFGGQCYGDFMMSLLNLTKAFEKHNIQYEIHLVQNESLITRARNSIVSYFMSTAKFTHLLFLDCDLIFDADMVLKMLASGVEIVGGCYPKKSLNMEKMLHYYNKGERGDKLLLRQTDLNYNLKIYNKNQAKIADGLIEVNDVPTGCMLIDKRCMAQIVHKNRQFAYKNNVAGYRNVQNFYDIFRVGVDENGLYLSEDYYFCKLARECGCQLWLVADATLIHIGRYNYHGNIGLTIRDNSGEVLDLDSKLMRNN
jgi:hypothetical protein